MKKKPVGRPRHNKQIKVHVSIRLTEEMKAKIKTKFGTIQNWIEQKVGEL